MARFADDVDRMMSSVEIPFHTSGTSLSHRSIIKHQFQVYEIHAQSISQSAIGQSVAGKRTLKKMVESVNHRVVANRVRSFLDDLRTQVNQAAEDVHIPTPIEIAEWIAKWMESDEVPSLRPVINGTGVLLHTGLGRAPLSDVAIQAIQSDYGPVTVASRLI